MYYRYRWRGCNERRKSANYAQKWACIFLDARFDDIYVRIKNDKNRPIVQKSTEQDLEELYNTRRKFYREAGHIQVLTANRTLRQIVEYIGFQVNRLKGE